MRDHIAELGFLSLGSRFKRLSDTLYQEMAQFYQSQGIVFDPGNFPLIHYLSTHGTASIGTAAKHLGISQAAVSQKAASLVKAGFITLASGMKDRRKSHMRMTAKGERMIARLKPSWNIVRDSVAAQLGDRGPQLLSTLAALEDDIARGELRARLKKALNKEEVRIIPFAKKHAHAFDALNRSWIKEYFSVEPFDHQVLTNPKKMIVDNGGEVWFAELDGKVVGTYALFKLKKGIFEFTKLGVDKSVHRRGIARALLKHSAKRAKARGAHTLRIFTSTKLGPACALYRSEGFREVTMGRKEKQRYCRCDIMFDLPLK